MSWDSVRSLLYRYWYFVLFGVLTLGLVILSSYYIRTQFAQRRERLRTVHTYEVKKQGELSPEHAPVDPLINDLLFPRPEVYRPLEEELPVREEWGPPIRTWELRGDRPSLQASPDLRGPS